MADVYLWDEASSSDVVLRASAADAGTDTETAVTGGSPLPRHRPNLAEVVRSRQRIRLVIEYGHQPHVTAPQRARQGIAHRHATRTASSTTLAVREHHAHRPSLKTRTVVPPLGGSVEHRTRVTDPEEELVLLLAAAFLPPE